ncbi:hypothetical protein V1525DRAFT_398599 [Lipomyces kononenkoae]|uniref:Uncharacterized protein n=1 Tax=Lipomyces kononenkoae TaxID=34357 RepID=A0ACC3T8Z6_LIPKO
MASQATAVVGSSATAAAAAQKQDKPRPHTCTTCLRAFARLEHLKRHERSHTKEKPFECPICERRFARRDLLLRHQQKLHTGLATTRQRQPRKNSITVATLGRPRKEPPPRPRSNTFSGPSSVPVPVSGPGFGSAADTTASTNSWLESTFGKGIAAAACDTTSANWYMADAAAAAAAAAGARADAGSPKATLFGSLFINPDLLPFTLPDNESLGLTPDEDVLEFDDDFWLGNLSIASPTTSAANSNPHNGARGSSTSSRPEDYASPMSYDTPVSTTSTVSSLPDNIKSEPGLNLNFAFPSPLPQPAEHTGRDIMSRAHMQTQVDNANRRNSPAEFDDNTISPALLLDHNHLHHLYSEMSIDPLSTFAAQPSPTPSMTSTTSRSSNSSSANTSIATSSPPVEHGTLPAAKLQRHSSLPSTTSSPASSLLPSRSKPGLPSSSTMGPEILYAGHGHASQASNMLLNTLSARNAFAPATLANETTFSSDFTSDLFGDLPAFTTMSQLHLRDSPSQLRQNSMF